MIQYRTDLDNTMARKYCASNKLVCCSGKEVYMKGNYCRDCLTHFRKNNNGNILYSIYRKKKDERAAKRLASKFAMCDVVPPTDEEKESASEITIARFIELKEAVMKANPGRRIMCSIALVSEGGIHNLCDEMLRCASLAGTFTRKANLIKIVMVDGQKHWRNPTADEKRTIGHIVG